MTVLQVDQVYKEYGDVAVLAGVSFHLARGERVGLVGANGCGKSTLVKILAGALAADAGSIRWAGGLSRVYLAQEGHWDPNRPLGEQLGPVPADLAARCGIAPAMLHRPAGSLSGGQKTRAALARALAGRPDVLLLDEPTNHLDTAGLEWLESLLISCPGTVLVVSHDRYFLDRVTTRILELAGGAVRSYAGSYSAYSAARQLELEQQEAAYRDYRRERARLEAAIRRQMQLAARVTRTPSLDSEHRPGKDFYGGKARVVARRAKAMQARLDRMHAEKPRRTPQVDLSFGAPGKLGRTLVQAEELGFTYDGARWLFRGAAVAVERGDRVAILGPNGSGKTTLLRLLLGQLDPTEGRVRRAPLRAAYLAQELEHLDPDHTVLEAALAESAVGPAAARTLLGSLLLTGDAVFRPVRLLSGGEKVRLALARILLSAPDLLALDEPTNGLDLPARERVEEALAAFPGTLLLISHDRYLLRRIATRVVAVEAGQLVPFAGGYAEWAEFRAHAASPAAAPGAGARGSRAGLQGAQGAQGARAEARAGVQGAQGARAEALRAARDQRLVLENRLAQLSAALAGAPPDEAERLTAEFLEVSRTLRLLRR